PPRTGRCWPRPRSSRPSGCTCTCAGTLTSPDAPRRCASTRRGGSHDPPLLFALRVSPPRGRLAGPRRRSVHADVHGLGPAVEVQRLAALLAVGVVGRLLHPAERHVEVHATRGSVHLDHTG